MLSPFNQVVGTWNANGRYRVRVPGRPSAWNGKIKWQWLLSKKAVGLQASFERGKLFKDGFLTYDLKKKQYVFEATRLPRTKVTYSGSRKDEKTFELKGFNSKTKKLETFILKLNHYNAYLWNFKEGRRFIAIVGCTIPGGFRGADAGPKCVVTGGLGSSTVTYKGKKYYVCCSGCVQAFNDNPEKYIAEAEARKKAKKK